MSLLLHNACHSQGLITIESFSCFVMVLGMPLLPYINIINMAQICRHTQQSLLETKLCRIIEYIEEFIQGSDAEISARARARADINMQTKCSVP